MSLILQTDGLTKTIAGKNLISNVNIQIKKGEIYGFLGPNGAGKTTIMKMLTNLWKPTTGSIKLFDELLTPNSYEVLKRIGSIIEFPVFYEHLSGKENLQLHCDYMGYYKSNCVTEALELLNLTHDADKAVKYYSLGMKQRLGLARAILTKPELLILDEPTNGLDPAGIKQIRDLLKMLCHEYGISIMISSHLLTEVESIADTIGLIQHGKMLKEVAMQEVSEMNTDYIEMTVLNPKHAAFVLLNELHLNNFKLVDQQTIRLYDQQFPPQTLTKTLALNNVEVLSIGKHSETLEDYFLKMTELIEERK